MTECGLDSQNSVGVDSLPVENPGQGMGHNNQHATPLDVTVTLLLNIFKCYLQRLIEIETPVG